MLGNDLVRDLDALGELHPVDLEDFDITKKKQCSREINLIKPDIVVHAAAYTQVDNCETNRETAMTVNGTGAANIAEACRDINAWMILYSTDYVFDGESTFPYVETDQTNPLSVYGRSKLAGEQYVEKTLPESHTIIRTSWLFGQNGPNFIDTVIRLSKTKNELRIVNDQSGSPTFTRDLSAATIKLIQLRALGIVNVTNSGWTTWFDLAKHVVSGNTSETTVVPIPTSEYKRPARRPKFSVLSGKKYQQLTGTQLPHWKLAVDKYLILKNCE